MLFVDLPHRMRDEKHYKGRYIIASKGLSSQGIALKHVEENKNNVYLRVAEQYGLYDRFQKVTDAHNDPIFVLGEIYGRGIQDLQYGISSNEKLGYRIFDIRIGKRWLQPSNLEQFCHSNKLEMVPYLYRGPFSKEIMEEYTNGKETISGKFSHIREGIVIRPVMERDDVELGRVILKNVSEEYLLRKGGTEFN
jgi:RNA ligase (TIGR02306 family)